LLCHVTSDAIRYPQR